MSQDGAQRIAAERRRQIEVEGYTPEHDAEHDGDLIAAAKAYATAAYGVINADADWPWNYNYRGINADAYWPWDYASWKPSADPVRNLEKAGALIAAEIDRLTSPTRRTT